MKDKVSELKKILKQKKTVESKKRQARSQPKSFDPEETISDNQSEIKAVDMDSDEQGVMSDEGEVDSDEQGPGSAAAGEEQGAGDEELQKKYDELLKANQIQKDMYLSKAAEFENYKKRLKKEHDDFSKFANEKLVLELLPIIDSVEMTLSHANEMEDDPFISGVKLIHKQFIKALNKFGVKEIRGEGKEFDPNLQEAIGTEKNDKLGSNKVVALHRTGYSLNGRVIRAAMVTVSE